MGTGPLYFYNGEHTSLLCRCCRDRGQLVKKVPVPRGQVGDGTWCWLLCPQCDPNYRHVVEVARRA